MNRSILPVLAILIAGPSAAIADEVPKGAIPAPPSAAKAFPYERGIVDLLVTGSAAKTLYDGLPGKGVEQACGASGLHKGDGKMSCARNGQDYACHIWLDLKAQTLTEAEIDDC